MSIKINRSQDGGEGNSIPHQGGAGEAGSVSSPAGTGEAGSAPQWVSKTDFDSFASRMEQNLSRFSQHRPEPTKKDDKPSEPGEPDPKDTTKYDWDKDPNASKKYNADLRAYFRHLDKQDNEKETVERAAKETQEKTIKGHLARVAAYVKEHPEAQAIFKNAISVNEPVKLALMRHKDSAAVVRYLIENPAEAQNLDVLNDSEDIDAVKYRIGEIASEIKSNAKALSTNASAAGKKPISFSNRGVSAGGKGEPSLAERVARINRLS